VQRQMVEMIQHRSSDNGDGDAWSLRECMGRSQVVKGGVDDLEPQLEPLRAGRDLAFWHIRVLHE
jgi:hypothetical protein